MDAEGDGRNRRAAVLRGVGAFVPPGVVTNDDLAARYDTTDEWIRVRTGITRRHVAEPGTAVSALAVPAGAAALRNAGHTQDDPLVDTVVLATSTADRPCPATAPTVAAALGLRDAAAFDVDAVCSGFVYGLAVAAGLISTGAARGVLLIGADVFSSIIDPSDRSAAAVFGDGAGAVVVSAGTADEPGALIAVDLGSDGALADLITVRAGGSERRPGLDPSSDDQWFSMQGRSVYRHAVRRMAASAGAVLKAAGWSLDELDHLVGHQANLRILEAVADDLGIPRSRTVVHVDRVGNTVAASIPLALADAASRGLLQPRQKLALTAFGGGATWGAVAMTWPELRPAD